MDRDAVKAVLSNCDAKRDHNYGLGVDNFTITTKEYATLRDLALQSLSQEAVRDEALEAKVDQTEFGAQGNCQSACLAMLLGVPLGEVPNFAQIAFAQDDNAADKVQQDWLHERGWGLVTIVKWQSLPWPPRHGFYIAGGTSKRGNRHGVVFKDGELWHDPHPDRTGIESVDDVDILYPLAPFRALKREPNAAARSNSALDETCLTIQRAVSDYTRHTPASLRDCDMLTGHIIRALKIAAAQAEAGQRFPVPQYEDANQSSEPAPAAPGASDD